MLGRLLLVVSVLTSLPCTHRSEAGQGSSEGGVGAGLSAEGGLLLLNLSHSVMVEQRSPGWRT